MLFRLLAPLLLVALAYWLVYRVSVRLQLNRQQFYWLLGISAALLFVLVLVLLGRLPVQAVAAPLLFLLTFLSRNAHWLARLLSMWRGRHSNTSTAGSAAHTTQASRIRTDWLEMTLDHANGRLDGEVRQGQFQGQHLGALDLEQLLQLAAECAGDDESLQLLQAYLDREHPDWEAQAAAAGDAGGERPTSGAAPMSEAEAFAILGLPTDADDTAIRQAHRRLMQKMHPDRGGSDYLAQRINQARDLLLSRD